MPRSHLDEPESLRPQRYNAAGTGTIAPDVEELLAGCPGLGKRWLARVGCLGIKGLEFREFRV